ncbi:MAG: calcium-binding EGF-like domain-containing protein, partial [Candidatus Aenigmarchaeota archaeon]|nr:calcium-binding EGF-like domain-containing protein [Candidatus Aenigmarchaeota archaeon]
SGTLTATLTTCGASYLAIVDDAAQTISSIPAGSTGYARWRVDPIANNTGCTVTVTVTGGKFWFSETSASLSKTIDITNSQAVVPVEEEEAAEESTPQVLSTCDVNECDSDEKCVNGVCTQFDCDNGYYSDHECIEYVYSINFTSVPKDLEIVQGNSSSIRIYYKNIGNWKIEDFAFTLEGLDNTSSYKVITNIPDTILRSEPQDVVMLINLSSDAPVGRHTITVWFRSDELTTSKTFILSILPDAESIAEIEKWMPELEKDIENLKESFDKIKDSINGTNYTFLNDTLYNIDILYAEAKNATLSGDFMTAYERKAQIEDLIAQANALISDQPLKKQGGTLRFMFLALLFIFLSIGAYIFYDQSRSNGYHIFRGLSISHLKQ